ncbi:hypothetical protein DAPPUDRAFT_317181 [Daphnia pulex]|uniref:Uncharacterized protein n=1 Tax=Daphnia pulex TaxID=6669 RepID=E9GF65_DAPPU|nr:hypothetical protein DAPPUDRAFT_317181 [Daphnia pulex]|eukprot:EFX81951.1 hypothetical protein DAPPUDRAFT_317181 [Daphnia pulex]
MLFDWAMITAWFRWMAVILQIWRSLSEIFFVVFCGFVAIWFDGDEGWLAVGVENGFGRLTGLSTPGWFLMAWALVQQENVEISIAEVDQRYYRW